jgi:uncharacterized protein
MIVFDTSLWIEVFTASPIGRSHVHLLAEQDRIVVPTIVQYEIYKWLTRERSADAANSALMFTNDCVVSELTTGIATLAAELSARHKLPSCDAIVYATARVHEAKVMSCDAHFKALPGVDYIEKPSASA